MLSCVLIIFHTLTFASCIHRRIYIERIDNNTLFPVNTSIEVPFGSNLTLHCALSSGESDSITWVRRSKDLDFRNEYDLYKLAEQDEGHITNDNNSTGLMTFIHIKYSDRGAYFCASVKYRLFKIVHIKVKNSSGSCLADKFRCISDGLCISGHYHCDGRRDCKDGSDEFPELCHEDPCEGKYKCDDGRCIPKDWCCDKRTDRYCVITIRHTCCPFLPNPYDPLIWYNNQEQNSTSDISKGTGPRYLFIGVCVVSAILSFVLFLFIISKVCGFDKKPPRLQDNNNEACNRSVSDCGHSECAITRELTGNNRCCLYRTDEVSDPLMGVNVDSDRPPSYAEAVNVEKTLEEAPPPSYASTKNVERLHCDTNL